MTAASSLLWPRLPGIADTPCTAAEADDIWLLSPAEQKTGTRVDATPIPRPSASFPAYSIADTIYGQVHLFPRLVETGLLISSEIRTVVLWNATFQSIELQQIGESQPAGSKLEGFAPRTILPTGEVRGELSVTASGPAQQRTVYTFATSEGSPTLTITASRVLLFPFWPDWGTGVSMEYTFDTVIVRSDGGGEQRRPLVTRPLRRLRATVWGNGLAGQRMRNLIQQGKDRVFGAPIWSEAITVSAIDASGTRVTVAEDISAHWNLTRLCGLVMLHDTARNAFYAVSVGSVNADSREITLTAALVGVSPAPTRPVRLVPLFLGILTSAEPTSVTDDLETWAVEFQEVAGSQPTLSTLGNTAPGTLRQWSYKPDWSGSGNGAPSANTALLRTIRTVRGGIMEVGSRQNTAPATLTQGYLLQRPELADFLDTITALRGRWGRFALHEPRLAFTLTREALPDASELPVRDNGFMQALAPDTPGVQIWLRIPPDVRNAGKALLLQRRILHAEPGKAGELILHLDQPHGVTIPMATRIGRAYVARLDTDNVSIRHITPTIARCALSFYELVEPTTADAG